MRAPRPPAPLLRRRRGDPRPFQQGPLRWWVVGGLLALAGSAWLPVTWPASAAVVERTNPLLSLFFMLAAIGHWVRLGRRSFGVAAALTALIYGATAWSPALGYEDFFAIALVSSFLVFALAGFNLVFILEEIVYDAHRLMHLAHTTWRFVPTFVVLALAWGLAWVPALRTLWVASIVAVVLLGGWWFVRAFNDVDEGPVLKELHLLVAGGLAMAAAVDGVRFVPDDPGILPSAVAYGLLVATWFYVSFTTLQRTSFLLQARDALPWLLVLLAASFALIHHALLHYRVEGSLGMTVLLNQRLAYLVIGMAIGMAFYVAHASWRVLVGLRDDRRLRPEGRIVAGRAARLAEGIVGARGRLIGGTYRIYAGVDHVLPRRGWELDAEGTLRPLEEE